MLRSLPRELIFCIIEKLDSKGFQAMKQTDHENKDIVDYLVKVLPKRLYDRRLETLTRGATPEDLEQVKIVNDYIEKQERDKASWYFPPFAVYTRMGRNIANIGKLAQFVMVRGFMEYLSGIRGNFTREFVTILETRKPGIYFEVSEDLLELYNYSYDFLDKYNDDGATMWNHIHYYSSGKLFSHYPGQQCHGIKKNGVRCSNNSFTGFCKIHKKQQK